MKPTPMSSNNNNNKNYPRSAFGIAIYILKCINRGQSEKEISQTLDNNEQLVPVWVAYLKGVHWIKKDVNGNLLVSEQGKLWIKKYEENLDKQQPNSSGIQQYIDYNYSKSQKSVIDAFQSVWT